MKGRREVCALLKRLRVEFPGLTWGETKGRGRCHLRITREGYPGVVFCSATPSDWRALSNIEADVRRHLNP